MYISAADEKLSAVTPPPFPASPHGEPEGSGPEWGKTLLMARFVELVVIFLNLFVAGLIGFQTGSVIAAVPFVAVAAVESARIPLARCAFHARGAAFKLLAVTLLLLASVLGCEQMIFAFEAGLSSRIEDVRKASEASNAAQHRVADLEREAQALDEQRAIVGRQLSGFTAEEGTIRASATEDFTSATAVTAQERADITARLETARRTLVDTQTRHRRETAAMDALCSTSPERCGMTALRRRHAVETAPLEQRIATLNDTFLNSTQITQTERSAAISRRERELASVAARKAIVEGELHTAWERNRELQDRLSTTRHEALNASATVDAMRRQSQPHRLASVIWGDNSDALAQRVLAICALIASTVISTMGAGLAVLAFRLATQDTPAAGASVVVLPVLVPAGADQATRHAIIERAVSDYRRHSNRGLGRVVPVAIPDNADAQTRQQLIDRAIVENG